MVAPFFALAIGALSVLVGTLLTAKKNKVKPPSLDDFKSPTSGSGKPVPIVWGTIKIESPNIVYYGEKSIQTRKVRLGKAG